MAKKKSDNKHVIPVLLDDVSVRKLRKLAHKEQDTQNNGGIGVSTLIRRAVDEFLRKQEQPQES